jgi:hypothetical protein
VAWSDNVSKPMPPGAFEAAQAALRARGKLTDRCAYCGCERRAHFPEPTYQYAKTGASSGKSITVYVHAPTCCDKCPACLDDCTAFVEPNGKNPKMRCGYVAEKKRDIPRRQR